jgi:hypothetical protein
MGTARTMMEESRAARRAPLPAISRDIEFPRGLLNRALALSMSRPVPIMDFVNVGRAVCVTEESIERFITANTIPAREER